MREAGFQRLTFRGDTDFSQTGHLDRWDGEGVRFVFGYDARANVIAAAEASLALGLVVLLFRQKNTLDADAWRELKG